MTNEKVISTIELDKQDYILATSCGAIAGLIDVIFVGNPNDSLLLKPTDDLADKFVVKAAQFFWKNDKRTIGKNKKMPTDLDKCISYLEQAFPVNYDARYAKDLNVADGVLEHMNPRNHHLLSLAHSPDPIGLVFSIVDQFNNKNTASFWDKGEIIHVVPSKSSNNPYPYFYGSDNHSKLFCGFVNWIGHLASDMVGSSSTRKPGKNSRGSGIAMPFYSLSQALDWGDFNGDSFAEMMTKVYEEGYDLRFGIASALPVIVNELLTRTVWTIRQRFIKKNNWKDSLPSDKDGDFRLFRLLSNTSFEIVDCADAAIRSVSIKSGIEINWVGFVSNVNLVGMTRLSGLVLKECKIRIGSAISNNPDALVKCISELIPDETEKKVLAMSETIQSYFEYLDYKKKLAESIEEYKEAKEQRINIEKQVQESIRAIVRSRDAMRIQVETYLGDYLVAVNEGVDLMDAGIVNNDSNAFIEGNAIIQEQFDRNPQFKTQDEFDELMGSDNDFIF